MITEESAILVISTSLLGTMLFFLIKEAYFYARSLLVTSRCAIRGRRRVPGHSLFNQRRWSFLMQTQHPHKLFDASAFRPLLPQDGKQAMIDLRPLFAPSLEGTSILKGTWSLL